MNIIPLRKLGALEKNQIAKQLTKGYASVTLTAILNHPPITPGYNPDEFYKKAFSSNLNELVQKHPALQVTVADADKESIRFEKLRQINIEDVVLVKKNEQFWNKPCLERIIQEECQHEFDLFDEVPLWRLRISCHSTQLNRCCVTLTTQHVIMDGISTLVFWDDLLQNLNNAPRFVPQTCNLASSSCIMSPPMEMRHFALPKKVASGRPILIPNDGWQGDFSPPENESLDTVVCLENIDGESWSKILRQAKQEQVSVHSMLYAAYLLAWASVYPARSVKTATAINCRQLCIPPVGKELGIFFGRFECGWDQETLGAHVNDAKKFWDFAHKYHTILQSNKEDTCRQALQLGETLVQFPEAYCNVWLSCRNNFHMGRSGGLNISDLGRFVPSACETWRLQEVLFCQSAHLFATVIALNIVTSCGKMNATFTWQRGSIEDHVAKQVVTRFCDILQDQSNQ